MKSIVNELLTVMLLLPLAGCWDFGLPKNNKEHSIDGIATLGHTGEHASKCNHKGCTHDHSKDRYTEHIEVETQSFGDFDDEEYDDDDSDYIV